MPHSTVQTAERTGSGCHANTLLCRMLVVFCSRLLVVATGVQGMGGKGSKQTPLFYYLSHCEWNPKPNGSAVADFKAFTVL